MHSARKEHKVDGIHTNGRAQRQRRGSNQERQKYEKSGAQSSGYKQFPFLVRAYWRINGEISIEDLNDESIKEREICLYLFLGSTYRDIVDQLKYQIDGVYRRDTVFRVQNVFLDQHGVMKKKDLGTVHSVKTRKEDDTQIRDCGFKVGDFLVIDIHSKNL